jgi:cytochrome c oxidase assembly factor CtaG
MPPDLGWDPAPAIVAAAVTALLLFARGFVTLRRRGRTDHAPRRRAVLFAAGLACAVVPLVSPLDALGERYLLSAHMLQHVLVGDAAPALMLLALRGPLLFFAVPAGVLKACARRRRVRSALGLLTAPAVAVAVWAAGLAAWHVPAAYELALHDRPVHDLEHATFLLGGTLVWTHLLDPARRGALTPARRLVLAGVVLGAGQLLGDVLLLAPHPLYASYAAEPDRVFGLSPLADQQAAGLVMMGEQLLTIGAFAGLALLTWTRRAPAPRPVPAAAI